MRFASLLFILFPCGLLAQEVSAFVPPAAYPLDRYEAGWNKNPFTLKTAPVVVATASFAADLAIGSLYGSDEDPTVVVVNTKTNVRTPLRKSLAHSSGMKLKSVTFGGNRKDFAADVTLGGETATLHFNDSYSKQMASAESAKAPAPGQMQPGGQPPRPQQGGVPVPAQQRPLVPVPPIPQPGHPPAQGSMQGNAQAPFAQPGFSPAQQPRNVAATVPGAQPQTSQGSAPVPVAPTRIRVVAPVTNTPALTQ